jgi:acid phosphatase
MTGVSRFRLLVVLGFVAVVGAVVVSTGVAGKTPPKKVTPKQRLASLKHIVVIYEENHSFDNLYGGWEGVSGLSKADAAHTKQVGQTGAPYTCLMQNDVNLIAPAVAPSCTDTTTGTSFTSGFTNTPFAITDKIPADATTCPKPVGAFAAHGFLAGTGNPGGCTADIVHRYYQEQYQIDGGKQDRYATGSDAVGLVMGNYDTKTLPIYEYLHSKKAPSYAIADNFFQGAFGGSFLNHQVLVAATAPVWQNAVNNGSSTDLHSVVDSNGMPNNYPLYHSPFGTAVKDQQETVSCSPPPGTPAPPPGVTCGDYAVNTTQPWYQPYSPGTVDAKRLPPLTNQTIGDQLTAKGIDWAWYSGGWSNADGDVGAPGWTNGAGPKCSDPQALSTAVYPNCPDVDFQFHHQAFNYYASFAPGTPARKAHLLDEAEFFNAANGSTKSNCGLKQVSFIKPIGEENEHPGYASESQGSDHLVELLQSIEGSACAKDTMVIVTYDEFGGQWDHVPPPGKASPTKGPYDQWGPGTRIPALVLAPNLPAHFVVDHTEHDTISAIATIQHRYGLSALSERNKTVPDMSSVWSATAASK